MVSMRANASGSRNKIPVHGNQHAHDSKSAAACGNHIRRTGAFPGHSGYRMTKIPEIFKGLLLYKGKQSTIADLGETYLLNQSG